MYKGRQGRSSSVVPDYELITLHVNYTRTHEYRIGIKVCMAVHLGIVVMKCGV